LWDRIAAERPFFGFAGANASASAIPWADYHMRFPSYQKSLELVSNHILLDSELTGSFQKDRKKIYQALRNGRFYFALDLLGDPKGFNALLVDKDATQYQMGSRVAFHPGLKLNIRLGQVPTCFYEIVVFKDGQRDEIFNEPEVNYELKGPGVYRVVVRVSPLFPLPDAKRWISWVYSNPFFVVARREK
jgi:hypothetical protein